jgi:aldehyde:ferredoxin oxidoreductase
MRSPFSANILRVNLDTGDFYTVTMDNSLLRKYLGGTGLATKILWDETTPDTGSLAPENPLIFMTGPLSGTAIPSSSRYMVAGISPLTGIIGQAFSGGSWAYQLRRSGWEGIIIVGRASEPIYLWLNDKKVEIRKASHIWGKDTYEVSEILKAETDPRASVASIGTAGEKLVKIACIMNDGKQSRAAARCGFGALMGSKRIKAVVVRGNSPVSIYDEARLKQSIARIYNFSPPKPRDLEEAEDREIELYKGFVRVGGAPIKNWREGAFSGANRIADSLRGALPLYCHGCPYRCAESKQNPRGERTMCWEFWGPMGTNCLIDNSQALEEGYALCNRYGMDAISTGGVISFAMECYEKGLITKEDTGGLDLTWGNHESMLKLIRQIGEREYLGKILGEGVKKAAEQIGGLAKEYAIHVKGLEFPAHDPRAANGIALQYATGSIGATHIESTVMSMRIEAYINPPEANAETDLSQFRDLGFPQVLDRFSSVGKGRLIAKTQDFGSMVNSSLVCVFLANRVPVPSFFAELLNNVTGWGVDFPELMTLGERIFNLRRMFNVRRGISRKDDTLPPRILTHKRGQGGAADNLPNLGLMLNDYYRERGWGEEGIPTIEKLRQLKIDECLNYALE